MHKPCLKFTLKITNYKYNTKIRTTKKLLIANDLDWNSRNQMKNNLERKG